MRRVYVLFPHSYAHSTSRKSPSQIRPLSPIINPDMPVMTGYHPERSVRQSSPMNGTTTHDLDSWMNTPGSGALKNLRDAMYESEQRRLALVEKLKEAHETLQVGRRYSSMLFVSISSRFLGRCSTKPSKISKTMFSCK